jgi:hypothetical protein
VPINNLFWDGDSGRDRHLLPGESLPLGNLLFAALPDGTAQLATAYVKTHADVTLTFRPLFKGVPRGSVVRGMGVSVDVGTGLITIDPPPLLTPPKANFVVEVAAVNAGTAEPLRQQIRIHVHRLVADVWLTPPRLQVRPLDAARPSATRFRFSVRAQFTDGVVGDVTVNHGVGWTSETPGAVSADGRLSVLAAHAPGQDVIITATFRGQAANATMRVERAWADEPTKPKAILSPGGSWPTVRALDNAMNVLIFGAGFPDADAPMFGAQVHTIVHGLHQSRITRPFDLLASSMNIWRLRLPSASGGVTFKPEMYLQLPARTHIAPLPLPQRPPAAGPWSLSHVVYAVGLPVRGDEGRSTAEIRGRWTTEIDPDPNSSVPNALVDEWKSLALRGFAEEVDQFPGLCLGGVPEIGENVHPNEYRPDDQRLFQLLFDGTTDAPLLRAFLATIEAENGATLANGDPLGRVWSELRPGASFDQRGGLVVLSSLPAGRAENLVLASSRMIMIGTTGWEYTLAATQPPARNAFTVTPWPIANTVHPRTPRVVAHELGHSFGLGDEYATSATRFTLTPVDLLPFGNLQADVEVRAAPAAPIDGELIRWRWHRISKAAVLLKLPEPSDAGLKLTVRPGEAKAFSEKDIVRLRVRMPGAPLRRDQTVLARDLKVIQVPAPDTLVVVPTDGAPLSVPALAPFLAGSIVYAPVPAPSSALSPTYPYAELIAKPIKDLISRTQTPLTDPVCKLVASSAIQVPDLRGVSTGLCRKQLHRVVGLYEGGALVACGIYHPTGYCIMRSTDESSRPFCPVCRYVLVDFLNPAVHAAIDREYDAVYPH